MADTSNHTSTNTPSLGLSEEERAIYDRQLRVWGVEAQKRLRESRVLLIGARGLSCEVAKNLVLAGIGSLVLLDSGVVSLSDLAANFLLRETDIGSNRAEACLPGLRLLNPNVEITALSQSLEELIAQQPEFFMGFRAIAMVGQSTAGQVALNDLLRARAAPPPAEAASATNNAAAAAASDTPSSASSAVSPPPAFFAGDCFGQFAYFFEDLQWHPYTETKKQRDAQGKETDEEMVVSGMARYTRSMRQLYEQSRLAEQTKKWGRKRQEKNAAQLWTAIRVAMQWREQQQAETDATAAVTPAPLPSLSDPAVSASLLSLRDSLLSRDGLPSSSLPDDLLLSMARMLPFELSHVCAIVGGILGQEILKVISGKDQPLANTFLYSAQEGYGLIKEL